MAKRSRRVQRKMKLARRAKREAKIVADVETFARTRLRPYQEKALVMITNPSDEKGGRFYGELAIGTRTGRLK